MAPAACGPREMEVVSDRIGVKALGVGMVVTPEVRVCVTWMTDSVKVVVRVEVLVEVGRLDLDDCARMLPLFITFYDCLAQCLFTYDMQDCPGRGCLAQLVSSPTCSGGVVKSYRFRIITGDYALFSTIKSNLVPDTLASLSRLF